MADEIEQLDSRMTTRVKQSNKDAYVAKCAEMKIDAPSMIREMMDAFTEGRVTINNPEKRKLYQ